MKENQGRDICEIRIRIHEEADLYNPLDPDQELLSDELIEYIKRKSDEGRKPGERLAIRIISDRPLDEERVRENFHSYLADETGILTKQQNLTRIKQARLFVIGIIFIAIWLYFAVNTDNVAVEVLSVIGSFAVWEAADIWIVEAPGLRLRRRKIRLLDETEIRFSTDGTGQD